MHMQNKLKHAYAEQIWDVVDGYFLENNLSVAQGGRQHWVFWFHVTTLSLPYVSANKVPKATRTASTVRVCMLPPAESLSEGLGSRAAPCRCVQQVRTTAGLNGHPHLKEAGQNRQCRTRMKGTVRKAQHTRKFPHTDPRHICKHKIRVNAKRRSKDHVRLKPHRSCTVGNTLAAAQDSPEIPPAFCVVWTSPRRDCCCESSTPFATSSCEDLYFFD